MHGKLRSQASYAQTDTAHYISYTYNYYKLENNAALRQKLSNKVSVIDSANGVIRHNAEIGKEVELMIDLREQVSTTTGINLEANLDFVHTWPPIFWLPMIPLPTMETNQYRSVAVTKVVNRYGILDSVLHIEKGSRVTTRDLVYDAETGQALLNQTNNEFDDPLYNFNYPAHWAYSGMGPAYKNIGVTLVKKIVRQGIMLNTDGTRFNADRYFESGDEILVSARDQRNSTVTDSCSPFFYTYKDELKPNRLWAIDAGRGIQQHKGINFIDFEGRPYNGDIETLKIIRSGKRNLSAAPLGTVTTMVNPIKNVAGKDRIVIDSTTEVIAASAARFKDMWKIDNVWKEYDSIAIEYTQGIKGGIRITPVLLRQHRSGNGQLTNVTDYNFNRLVASYQRYGNDEFRTRALLKLKWEGIPDGAIIQSAKMNFYGSPPLNMWGHSPWNSLNYSYEGIGEYTAGVLFRYPYPFYGSEQVPWANETSLNNAAGPTAALPTRGYINSCENYGNIDVTSIIQSMQSLAPEYRNLVLKLNTEARIGSGNKTVRFMSFYGVDNVSRVCNPIIPCANPCPVTIQVSYLVPNEVRYKVCRSKSSTMIH